MASFPEIILASASPRRHQLLQSAGIPFRVEVPQGEEVFPSGLPAAQVPQWLAAQKAWACQATHPRALIIAADTLVLAQGEILGKPRDLDQARAMLRQISASCHEVITGVHLLGPDHSEGFSVSTQVYFRELSDSEIQYYLEAYSPLDKAGAYGIQEWIGLVGIEKIHGDYYNVMGLPIGALWIRLRNLGFPLSLTQRP